MKRKNKGFTLIELIVVLVILAIISLIATPIILNIVDKAQVSAYKRSVDAYGKAIELAIAEYLLDTGDYPTTLENLDIKYSGYNIECKIIDFKDDNGLYLSKCIVDGVEIKDDSTEDGYYHYDSNSYKNYKIGDKVTYKGMEFYVIENSNSTKDYVTLLKAEPLTIDEVSKYGVGHVNRYTLSSQGTAYDNNGYGGMVYYSSKNCGYVDGSYKTDECINSYDSSDIKYVVDDWAINKCDVDDLKTDNLGYKVRLLTYEDLFTNLGYEQENWNVSGWSADPEKTPSWVGNYNYWTMSPYEDYDYGVLYVSAHRYLSTGVSFNSSDRNHSSTIYGDVTNNVRPVINLFKKAILN